MFSILEDVAPNNKGNPKFKQKLRTNYYKLIFITSLFWIIVDVLLVLFLFSYSPDFICKKLVKTEDPYRSQILEDNFAKGQFVESRINGFENKYTKEKNKPIFEPKKDDLDVDKYDDEITKDEYDEVEDTNESQGFSGNNSPGGTEEDTSISREERNRKYVVPLKYRHKASSVDKQPGFNGNAVVVPKELQADASRLFKLHQFNLVASDLVPKNRVLPDIRTAECKAKKYPINSLPTTSIIIVFHNEAWSTLVRTLWSIINRTPHRLLKQIVLVDDASYRDFLGAPLEEYIGTLPVPVLLERMGTRSGLVRSRLRGASVATGQTMTFLDAHCECSPGWLEPLLYQVHLNSRSVVSPLIDVITDQQFEYRLVPNQLAGFDWRLLFDWVPAPEYEVERRKNDQTLPLRTPTFAGGLFTIDRDFFYEIGSYDENMNIWGGENLEMSFRLWMCGSEVLISPCSRVGHVYRAVSPYTFPEGTDKTVLTNQMRTMEVWLGAHKKFYYKSNPFSAQYPLGDISQRLALKERLGCRDFKWYLTNVFRESPLPLHFYSVGHIKNVNSDLCLHVSIDGLDTVTLKSCFSEVDRQVFSYTGNKTLMTTQKKCLTLQNKRLILTPCSADHVLPQQTWIYHAKRDLSLQNPSSNLCMAVKKHNNDHKLTAVPCQSSPIERFILEEYGMDGMQGAEGETEEQKMEEREKEESESGGGGVGEEEREYEDEYEDEKEQESQADTRVDREAEQSFHAESQYEDEEEEEEEVGEVGGGEEVKQEESQGFSGNNSPGGTEEDTSISREERNRKYVVPLKYRHKASSVDKQPGFNGNAVVVPKELQADASRLFKLHQFNLVASDLVPKDRVLPDIRTAECKAKKYPIDSLPTTSIIIVFHNEAWSTLVRTLWSIINRTPHRLLKQIVLVDDASYRDFLGAPLEEYIGTLPVPVLLERMGTRSGLVRSRLRGASVATGQTVTFLDAHCECSPGWLEPLLYQVHLNSRSVVSPLIDVITDQQFEYRLVPNQLAGFDWKLLFDWVPAPDYEVERRKNDQTLPLRTPTFAGGLFTIDRDFFYEIGSYDENMNIWGGENLEMSFRLWMCGSEVLISPCSRVGHVYRAVSPYTFPEGTDKTVLTNQMRTMEVWLGAHKKFYYKSNPFSAQYPLGDISQRLALKERLGCRDFKWYLTNVFRESPLPLHFYSVGHIKNVNSDLCLHVSTDGLDTVTLKSCFSEVDRQVFSYTGNRTLMTMQKKCLTLQNKRLILTPCSADPVLPQQTWIYHAKRDYSLENPESNFCIAVKLQNNSHKLTTVPCQSSAIERFVLEEYGMDGMEGA